LGERVASSEAASRVRGLLPLLNGPPYPTTLRVVDLSRKGRGETEQAVRCERHDATRIGLTFIRSR